SLILSDLQPILAGAMAVEETFNRIELPKAKLEFICDPNTLYSEYSVKGTGIHIQTPTEIFFSPTELTHETLYTWTLQFNAPFPVSNALALTSPENLYVFIYDQSTKDLAQYIYDQIPPQINIEMIGKNRINSINSIPYKNIKFVFFTEPSRITIPEQILKKSKAIEITENAVVFLQKNKNKFSRTSPEISYPRDPQDFITYAAIFSADSNQFKCQIKKLLKRYDFQRRIYLDYIKKLSQQTEGTVCQLIYDQIINFLNQAQTDLTQPSKSLNSILNSAQQIEQQINSLEQYGCPQIY
ncbi:hypothetical protein DRJ16_01450, partial [Candidatus Woesearchaeota archaeon]